MKHLRARIERVQTRSLSCLISKNELTDEELQDKIKDGEHEFPIWINFPMKATFKLRNPKLYDYSLSLLNSDIILGIESGEIISIEEVTRANECDFCDKAKLRHKFTNLAICSGKAERRRYYSNRQIEDNHNEILLRLSKEFDGDMKASDDDIKVEYYYKRTKEDQGSWMPYRNSYGGELVKTRWTYAYKCAVHPICIDCIKTSQQKPADQTTTVAEILQVLKHGFYDDNRIFNVDKVLIKPESHKIQ